MSMRAIAPLLDRLVLVIEAALMGQFLYLARHDASPLPHYGIARLTAVLIALIYIFMANSVRPESRRFTSLAREVYWTLQVDITTLIIALFAVWVLGTEFPLRIVVFAVAATLVVQIPLRALLRLAVRYLRTRGRNTKYVALLGRAEQAASLADLIAEHPELGLRVVATLAPERAEDLSQLFLDRPVDVLLSAAPLEDLGVQRALQIAQIHGKEVRVVIGDENKPLYVQAVDFFGHALVTIQPTTSAGTSRIAMKRVFDIVFSAVLIVLSAPLIAVAALAIKLDDRKSPVFFRQRRVGLQGRTFEVFKLRTMVPEAETMRPALQFLNEMDGPVFKIRNDPRVTRPGRWIRRYSIDEMPQFWNVLLGHMSLVGPRPPLPDEVRIYADRYRRRLSVRPGITGAWQVSGRNDIGFAEWMELDLQYIDQWSLALDLQILAKTVPSVLSGRGAS